MSRAWNPPRVYALLDAAVAGARVEDFGCRVAALVEAQRAGLPVGQAWALSASVYREAVEHELPPGHDPASLIRSIQKPSGLERTARARDRLRELSLPETWQAELETLAKEHGPRDFGLSLRSSPTLADDTLVLAAGLDRVIHGVRSFEALQRAVVELWSLVFDERALSVLREHRVRDLSMGVLIQALPEVKASLLVQNGERPATEEERRTKVPSPESHLACASLGLGSPVREGAAPHDVLRLAADGSVLARRLAEKPRALVVGGAGLSSADVDASAAAGAAVSDEVLARATQIVRRLDPSDPRQVELYAASDGALLVAEVQRCFGHGQPVGEDDRTVWSRTGIADLLPGVPTPLTASVVEDFCESSLRTALGALGAEVPKGPALLGRVRGRYYLNVSALVPAISGVPGVDAAVVLELLRGADPVRIARAISVGPPRRSFVASSVAAARLLLHEKRLGDAVARFEREAEQHRRWLEEMDLAILPDDSLVTTLRESHGFLKTTGELLLKSSIIALAGHLALEAMLARIAPDAAGRLARVASSGVSGLESVRSSLALAHVVEILRSDPATVAALQASPSCVAELPSGPGRRALESWLEGFGERGLSETDAGSPRFREDPSALFRMLRAGLAAPAADPELCLSRVRANADSELASLEQHASGIEMMLIRALLERARSFARLRERMRVWMARTMAMMRTVALDVDRRLRRLDPALRSNAVFFLTRSELVSATSRTRADLGPLIRMRRARHLDDLDHPDPPDTFMGVPSPFSAPSFDGRVLRGIPASSGVATGRVRHVTSAAEGAERVEPGDVVVLRVPDPGLAPLFFWCGAVVADAGSALSHAAVVAREVGTPAVFGVVDAWSTLREGERVSVDGDRGLVERLGP